MPQPSSNTAVTLDQLIALNDEIVALARAGVPLDRGLRALGRDLPNRLGQFALQLAERIERGQSLADALALPSLGLPRAYCAVVAAGARAGRLPAALQSLAGAMRRLAEMRRSAMIALVYPLLLLVIAWILFALTTSAITPALSRGFAELNAPTADMLRPLVWLGRGAFLWGPVGPVVVLGLAALWWGRVTRGSIVDARPSRRMLGWLPWLSPTLRLSRQAVFVEVLALLIENRVPLDEAVLLAGEASGDGRLADAARRRADAIRRGQTLADPPAKESRRSRRRPAVALPPLVDWLIGGGLHEDRLVPALRGAADDYRRRAQYRADLARVMLPALFTLSIGGGVVLIYTLILFIPYTSILKALAAG